MAGILEELKTVKDANEILKMDEREFKALIGVSPQAFAKLLESFANSYAERKAEAEAARSRPRQRQAGGGRKHTLPNMASKLGFILHYFKRYATLDDLGDRAGFHRSNASHSVQWLLQVLLHTLAHLNVLPKREFADPAEVRAAFAGIEALVIDATAPGKKQRTVAKKTAQSQEYGDHQLTQTDSLSRLYSLGQSS